VDFVDACLGQVARPYGGGLHRLGQQFLQHQVGAAPAHPPAIRETNAKGCVACLADVLAFLSADDGPGVIHQATSI
jgi:hypothetical protein